MADDQPTAAQLEAADRWFEQLCSAPQRYAIGESPGAEADLRLRAACLRIARGESVDVVLKDLGWPK